MKKPSFRLFTIVLLGWMLLFSTAQAMPIAIDLNDFFADPTVTVAPDGSSAVIAEDPPFSSVLLSNDPGLGDPNVIIPGIDVLLRFAFDFDEGSGENDEFGAFVIDAATGLSAGSAFEFFTQNTSSGSVSFDLSSLVGQTLGLQFQLTSLPGDTGLSSTVTVSNVRLASVAVPEPSVLLLFTGGLIGWLVQMRWKTIELAKGFHT